LTKNYIFDKLFASHEGLKRSEELEFKHSWLFYFKIFGGGE